MGYCAKTNMKKTLKKVLAIALSVAMCASIATVAPSASAAPKAKKITLNKKKLTLTVGSKYTLKVKKTTPKKANKKVTWKSSKKSVASVTKKGVVKAKAEGTAKITAKSKSNKKVKAVCKVTVRAASTPQVTAPVVSPTSVPSQNTVIGGDTPTASPVPTPTNTPRPTATPYVLPEESLKENISAFNIGTVVNRDKTLDKNFTALAAQQFDIVSFENEMKGYSLIDVGASQTATADGDDSLVVCQFGTADEMVQWAIDNGLKVRGHVLFWENSMADAFFYKNYDTEGELVDKETLMKRMKSYADQVITHFEETFPDTVIAWDVVNEAIDAGATEVDPETGLHLYTTGKFYQIFGSGEYVKYAFQCANDAVAATGKDIDLFYNDFNCFQSPKTQYILDLIDYLNSDSENPLIECMGMEGYVLTYWPSASEFGAAMQKFADKGLKVGVNEVCIRLSPQYSSDGTQVTENDITNHAQKCEDMFKTYCDFAKKNPGMLTNVSIWALTDRPDLMSEAEKDEADRHYDYAVYGTHSGLFTEELREKEAFNKVIAVLKDYQ